MSLNAVTQQGRAGVWYTVSAYTLWGFLPLYWKLLETVPALEVLAHRVLWSFGFTLTLILIRDRNKVWQMLTLPRRKLVTVFLCGVLISFNWYTYIWAVNSNHVIQASMGYYISPLMVVLLSVLILKESLDRWKITAAVLATAGVLIITLQYGQVPWVALVLAGTFSLYSLAKKVLQVNALTGLFLETTAVAPLALLYVLVLERGQLGHFTSVSVPISFFLMGAGAITAMPLLLFAQGAQRIRLSTVGFFQYIAPSITLLLGVFVFGEVFSTTHLISFGLIWVALVLFTLSNVGMLPLAEPAKMKARP